MGLGPSIHPGFWVSCSPGGWISGWVKLEDPGPRSAAVPQLQPRRPLTAPLLCRCWFGKEPGDLVDYIYQGPIILVLLVGGAAMGWAPGQQRGPTHQRFWGRTRPGEAPCTHATCFLALPGSLTPSSFLVHSRIRCPLARYDAETARQGGSWWQENGVQASVQPRPTSPSSAGGPLPGPAHRPQPTTPSPEQWDQNEA